MELIISAIIVIIVIAFQCHHYFETRKMRLMYRNIFPRDDETLLLSVSEDENELECPQIDILAEDEDNVIFESVRNDINKYLSSNKGSVEYAIIKDITDRHCYTLENQIETTNPIPIYIGLCGTVLGIILGVVFLTTSGGLTALTTSSSSGLAGIHSLLSGIAVAMTTTFVGVYLTIRGSIHFKNTSKDFEERKNIFLSWVQVNLLPQMDGNMVTTLSILQRNLNQFNKDFSKNSQELNNVLGGANSSYKEQAKLVNAIKELDIDGIATANVKVLVELRQCTDQINLLQEFVKQSGQYLSSIVALNSNLSDNYERTQLIENMGKFFMDEIQQIKVRKAAIVDSVTEIDSSLNDAFRELKEHAHNEYNALKENTSLEHASFLDAVKEQQNALKERLAETSLLLEELHNLSDVKNSMLNLLDVSKAQGKYFEELNKSMLQMKNSQSEQISLLREMVDRIGDIHVDVDMPAVKSNLQSNYSLKIPIWLTITGVTTCLIIAGTCIYFVIKSIW